jgi:L-ascorbate metabolism protein UlaG (beta-lactamase superfamily)
MGMGRPLAAVSLPWILASFCSALLGAEPQAPRAQTELDDAVQWLWQNPPNGKNRDERRKRQAVIQSACDQVSPDAFNRRHKDPDAASLPANEFLRKAASRAVADVRAAKVMRGAAIWFVYNMGYIVKTPDACFAFDLVIDDPSIARDLDFLLISHKHADHSSAGVLNAMRKAGKPVLTNFFDGGTLVTHAREFRFGAARVKVDIGQHYRDREFPVLMYQVDCGKAGNDVVLYHSGDGARVECIQPDKPVDVFIPHISVGLPVVEAAQKIQARMTLVSHVLEMAHSPTPPNAWRWSFDYSYGQVKALPEDRTAVLVWGERWLTPRTVLDKVGMEGR